MEKVLTIAVAAFNVEAYIKDCLASMELIEVLDKIEVLVIDDGATDGTMEIAETFAKKHPQTYRTIYKENAGHGSVLNCAIKEATGKYFMVVDGDDWVNSDRFSAFVDILQSIDSDVVASDYFRVKGKKKKRIRVCNNLYHYKKEWGFSESVNEPTISIHSMTIKTKILKGMQKLGITFAENCFYDDREFVLFTIPFSNTVYFHPHAIYEFRVGREDQSESLSSMMANCRQYEKILDHILIYMEDLRTGHHPVTYKKSDVHKDASQAKNDIVGYADGIKDTKAVLQPQNEGMNRKQRDAFLEAAMEELTEDQKEMLKIERFTTRNTTLQEYKRNYLEKAIARMAETQIKIYLAMGDVTKVGKESHQNVLFADEEEVMVKTAKQRLMDLDRNLASHFPEIYKRMSKRYTWALRKSNYVLFDFLHSIGYYKFL